MILSEEQKKYLDDFFSRQRNISKQALMATTSMAQANMEMILLSGLSNVQPRIMEEVQSDKNVQNQLDELKKEMKTVKEDVEDTKKDIELAQTYMRDTSGQA